MNLDDRELERLARDLHVEWDSPELWPRIRRTLEGERTLPRANRTWRLAAAVAALVVLTVALPQMIPTRPPSPPDTGFLTRETLREVERAEAAYARSIEKLSAVSGLSLEKSATPLAAAYREKLAVLDSAIAELKVQMDANRYNNYLRNQLASLYREKQATLEEWLKNAKDN
jgi:hypothetical protein